MTLSASFPDPVAEKAHEPLSRTGGEHAGSPPVSVAVFAEPGPHGRYLLTNGKVIAFAFAGSAWSARAVGGRASATKTMATKIGRSSDMGSSSCCGRPRGR